MSTTMTKPGKIVYFDATESRREKMRHNAAQPVAQPAIISAPVPETVTVIAPVVETVVEPVVEPVQSVASGPSYEELHTYLINFAVEQTGYPDDFVSENFTSDLEGTLGIDSIKKAQLLGELNEMFHFADISSTEDSTMSLDDFPTLQHILEFMAKRLSGTTTASPAVATSVTASPVVVTPAVVSSVVASAPAATSKLIDSKPIVETPTTSVASGPSYEELHTYLINFAVEQTGYPDDFVSENFSSDLEGTLGIDSIKKAQLLGELNEMFHFADISSTEDSTMSLDDFPTLQHILEFMAKRLSGTAPASSPEPTANPESTTNHEKFGDLKDFLINFVIEQTSYPEYFVKENFSNDLEGTLGIDSIKKAQLFGELINIIDIVPIEHMTLDDFKTLEDIYRFVVNNG